MIIGIGGFAITRVGGAAPLWTPAALGANLGLWFDADDASTFTLVGTAVSEWRDKSGNNRHATQVTAANRPVYTTGGLNGKPVVTFDGVNDFLSPSAFTGSRIQSSAVVVATTAPTTDQHILDESNSIAYGGGLLLRFVSTSKVRYWAQDASPITDSTTSVTSGAYNIAVGVESTSSRILALNGTIEATVTPGTSARNAANPRIGTSVLFGLPFKGSLSEIVIAATNLSTTDRQKLEGYLAWKWGLVSKLPVSHPYKSGPPTL